MVFDQFDICYPDHVLLTKTDDSAALDHHFSCVVSDRLVIWIIFIRIRRSFAARRSLESDQRQMAKNSDSSI